MAEPITSVTGTVTPADPLGAKKANNNKEIFSSQSFLRLLGAQMKSQNPLEPMKDTEFVAQMAQFSQLEQVTSMTASLKALNMTSQLTQGAALIGRQVTYVPTDGLAPITGTVERMMLLNGGRESALVVGGVQVSIDQVREVK